MIRPVTWSRRWAPRVSCALLTLAFIAGTALGNASYVWCVPMAKVMSTCCPPSVRAARLAKEHRHRRDTDTASAMVRASCCKTRHFDQISPASTARAEVLKLPAPDRVAVAAVFAPAEVVPNVLQASARPASTGPPSTNLPEYLRLQTLLL
jgi:hypothetical protein